jgi:cyclopropane fatty-acyl-phospholipid synthase-like methyltransferase
MKKMKLQDAVEWRVDDWTPAFETILNITATKLPAGSRVLELGYGTGKMSCYLAGEFGWHIEGYEINPEYYKLAPLEAEKWQVSDLTNFHLIKPEDTFKIKGSFDAVFLKSFLYHVKERQMYEKWINWFYEVLKPNGVLFGVENSKGHLFDRTYRHLFTNWGDQLLFDKDSEQMLKKTFPSFEAWYFGYASQYFSSIPTLANVLRSLENKLDLPRVGNSFVTAFHAQK